MSVKVMDKVWDSDLPNNEKFVLLCYADLGNHEGTSIFPSIGYVAWLTGYGERQIQYITKSLVKRGILLQVGWSGLGTWKGTKVYKIEISALPTREPYIPKEKDNLFTSLINRGAISAPPTGRGAISAKRGAISAKRGAENNTLPVSNPLEYPLETLAPKNGAGVEGDTPESLGFVKQNNYGLAHVMTVDERKARTLAAMQRGAAKHANEAGDWGWLDERLRPLAEAFLDKVGDKYKPAKKEQSLWRMELNNWIRIPLTISDIVNAVDYMREEGLTIKGPQSITGIARDKASLADFEPDVEKVSDMDFSRREQ